MFEWLSDSSYYFNEVISLGTTPMDSFTSYGRSGLVADIMDLLTNPIFLWFIGVIVIMSILPTVNDD